MTPQELTTLASTLNNEVSSLVNTSELRLNALRAVERTLNDAVEQNRTVAEVSASLRSVLSVVLDD